MGAGNVGAHAGAMPLSRSQDAPLCPSARGAHCRLFSGGPECSYREVW